MLFKLQKNELQRKTIKKVFGIFYEFIFHAFKLAIKQIVSKKKIYQREH
jgi:hypothetical protein